MSAHLGQKGQGSTVSVGVLPAQAVEAGTQSRTPPLQGRGKRRKRLQIRKQRRLTRHRQCSNAKCTQSCAPRWLYLTRTVYPAKQTSKLIPIFVVTCWCHAVSEAVEGCRVYNCGGVKDLACTSPQPTRLRVRQSVHIPHNSGLSHTLIHVCTDLARVLYALTTSM